MIRISNLTWENDPNSGNPIAYYSADMSVDTVYEFALDSNFLDKNIHANAITINNLVNDSHVIFQFGNSSYTILGRSRRTFSVPYSCPRATITGQSTGGTVQVIFQVQYSAQGDDTDFLGIQSQAGSAVLMMEVNKAGVNQVLPASTVTLVTFSTALVDTIGTSYDFINSRFVPSTPAWYLVTVALDIRTNIVDQAAYQVQIRKNGSAIRNLLIYASGVNLNTFEGSVLIFMNGSPDYIDVTAFGAGAGSKDIMGALTTGFFRALKLT